MTEKEFQQVKKQVAEYNRRTSFPALPREHAAEQQLEARSAHAEYGCSRH